jgi:GAF domain-containing protein
MASSSERSEALELLQSRNEEGPCFDCFRGGTPVFSENLRADSDRWPMFAPAAVRRGINSVHAIPMRVHSRTIGALNLFRAGTGRLAERDVPLGQGMADIAAVALIQERAMRETRSVVQQLQNALNSRILIEQAKGVLAERGNVNVDVAFTRIRSYARAHNNRLTDIARDIINGQLNATALAELAPQAARQARP